jgi:hypothetical protein
LYRTYYTAIDPEISGGPLRGVSPAVARSRVPAAGKREQCPGKLLHHEGKYREQFLLFHNTVKIFQNVSQQSGPVFSKYLSARGMAISDFNNDGAVDVLVSVNDDAPLLLKNKTGNQNHWLGLTLVGTKSNRDAVGARITCQAGDRRRTA